VDSPRTNFCLWAWRCHKRNPAKSQASHVSLMHFWSTHAFQPIKVLSHTFYLLVCYTCIILFDSDRKLFLLVETLDLKYIKMFWHSGFHPRPHLDSLITAFPRPLDFGERYKKREKGKGKKEKRNSERK